MLTPTSTNIHNQFHGTSPSMGVYQRIPEARTVNEDINSTNSRPGLTLLIPEHITSTISPNSSSHYAVITNSEDTTQQKFEEELPPNCTEICYRKQLKNFTESSESVYSEIETVVSEMEYSSVWKLTFTEKNVKILCGFCITAGCMFGYLVGRMTTRSTK